MHLIPPLLIAATAVATWVGACAAGASSAVRPAESASAPGPDGRECTVRETWRGPLKPAPDQELYVEAKTMLAAHGEVYIAGRPTYLWQRIGEVDSLLSRNDVFGVLISPDRSVRIIPSPLGSTPVVPLSAGSVRPGVWGVVFAELTVTDEWRWRNMNEAPVKQVMYGEYSAGRWSRLAALPVPPIERPIPLNSSLVVSNGDTVVWGAAVIAELNGHSGPHAVVVERVNGAWRRVSVTSDTVPSIAYVAAAHVPQRGFVLAIVHPEYGPRPDANSVFLYRRSEAWTAEGKLIAGGDEGAHRPTWHVVGADTSILSWVTTSSGLGNSARAAVGPLRPGTVAVQVLDNDALATPLALPFWRSGEYWLVNTVVADTVTRMRVLRRHDGRIHELWSAPNPYTTEFAAVSTDGHRALLSGPLLQRVPPKLTSLLVELQLSCSP